MKKSVPSFFPLFRTRFSVLVPTIQLLAVLALQLASASAQSEVPTPPVKPTIANSGSLSTTYRGGGSGGISVGNAFNDIGVSQGNPDGIGGSLSRLNSQELRAVIVNNTQETYSISLEAIQSGASNRKLKSDYFSATLKPGETYERLLRASPSFISGELRVRSTRQLSKTAESLPKTNGLSDEQGVLAEQ